MVRHWTPTGRLDPDLLHPWSASFHATLPAPAPRVGRAAFGGHPLLGPCRTTLGLPHGAGKLRQESWAVNFKRVHRLWKQAGLHVPTKVRKRRTLGSRKHGASRVKATRRNHVWSYDFIFDQTSDRRRLKWLALIDKFTMESLALEVDLRLESSDVIAVLDQAVEEHGAPEFIRSDNAARSSSPRRSAAG